MTFEIKDLTGLGQPLSKLFDVISAGIGTVYRPSAIRREADANAYAARTLGQANLEVEVARLITLERENPVVDSNTNIETRALYRQTHKEMQRQLNVEAVSNAAIDQMPDAVSDEPVNEDWRTRFFNIAEDVSDNNMQQLWGKILAGEVTQPGSFSLRTLEVIRNITQKEAQEFQIARYLATNKGMIFKCESANSLEEFGLTYEGILRLRESGLLLDGDLLSMNYKFPAGRNHCAISYNGKGLLFTRKKAQKEIKLSVLIMSSAGIEMLKLIEPMPNFHYLKNVASFLAKSDYDLSIGTLGTPVETFEKIIN